MSHSNTASATPNNLTHNTFKSACSPNSSVPKAAPPPIPIPHLLLHRSRLKPVPRPQPAPLQPPTTFNHLIPLRSKLRSTTSPNLTIHTPSNHPPVPSNSHHLNNSRSVSGPQTSLSPAHDHPPAEPIPIDCSPNSEFINTIVDKSASTPFAAPIPNDPNSNIPLSSDSSSPSDQSHINTPPEILQVSLEQPAPQSPLPQSRVHSLMDDTLDHLTPLSSQSTPPDQSFLSSSSSPQDSPPPQSESVVPQDPHAQIDNNQDQIQPWQNQLAVVALDHSSLERANSAAARLDSLARLNGVRIPETSGRALNLDVLPPFLMAKHIEETKKKVELGLLDQTLFSQPLPLANYPLLLPASLGFSVGPNGRGVPRLSALQRKALEKVANQQGSADLSTATTSLTRSHTTTGTESLKHLINRIQPCATDESHERQQARSNLIRKLSSRGANSRPKLQIQSPPPTQSLGGLAESVNNDCLLYAPEIASSLIQSQVKSPSQVQPPLVEPFVTSHPAVSLNSAAHSLDPNQVQLPQLSSVTNLSLDTSLRSADEPVIRSPQSCISHELTDRHLDVDNMTSNTSRQCAAISLRSSLNLLDNHADVDQSTQLAPQNVDSATSDSSTPTTSPPSPIAQPTSQQARITSHKPIANTNPLVLPHTDSSPSEPKSKVACSLGFPSSDGQSALAHPSGSDANAQLPESHHPHHVVNAPAATEPIIHYRSPAPCSSSRSSIASRLMARTSLSSRIERSTASGRPASPNQHSSQQPPANNISENKADHRRSAVHANFRISRPSYPSTLQRVRPVPNETSEDLASKSTGLLNRGGAMSPKPLLHGDRPLRPTNAPPITEAHNVVGRGLAQQRNVGDLGPSQFPPTSTSVRTHMPVASAVDLARYNDQKLAPFPGLLNMTPPSSPEPSKSPRSNPKSSKSTNHGILSNASHFFRSPTRRNREGSISNEVKATPLGLAKDTGTLSPSKHSKHMSHFNDEEEEVVSSSRWQSIGDVAEKMSSLIQMPCTSTGDSNRSSFTSMISNQRREQILARLSPFLKSPVSSSSQNSRLHDPPRKLLWHQPVLQVANSASFKDRYLFLFNDILVITKPLLEFDDRDGERVPKLPITLKQSFLTKSVVELKDLRFMTTSPYGNSSSPEADLSFKEAFKMNPSQAIESYLNNMQVHNREPIIVKLLLSTPDLDKRQLGQYLSSSEHTHLLRYYLEQMNFAFMRVEDALRTVLLSLRLPADPDAITRFLEQFGIAWTTCNPKICLSATLVTRWATAMIVLSECLHDGLVDSMRYVAGLISFPSSLKTEADFVDMIKADYNTVENKSSTTLPVDKLEAMLKKAYQSIRRDRLVQARANAEDTEKIHLSLEDDTKRLQLPHQLTYQVPSDLITISIPQPDAQFGIKLFGPGLSFEPSFLSFSHSPKASFRMKGKAIGNRQVSFVKIGRRAAAYEGLPLNAMVSVERAFMKHTVQVGFYNHLSVKRKYLISFHDSEPKAKFIELVTKAQNETQFKSPPTDGSQGMGKIVALQVLRDTLILNEDLIPMNVNPYTSTTVILTTKPKKNKANQQNENEGKKSNKIRSNSLSETYVHTIGSNEKDLHQAIIDRRNQAQELHVRNKQKQILKEQLTTNLAGGKMGLDPYSCSNKENPVGVADENQNQFLISRFVKTGFQLIQHCEQNSLIPLVLSFLSMGVSEKARTNSTASKSKVLNSYTSLGNLHTSQQHENHFDDSNKTVKKPVNHLDHILPNHTDHHQKIAATSSFSTIQS